MSSSIASIIFISAILLLSSTPQAASPPPLIKKVCAGGKLITDVPTCENGLQAEPRVASAKNLYELSIEIIKLGITKSNTTLDHIKTLLKETKTDSNGKNALGKCKSSYDLVIMSFKSALGEVEIKEYETASYDLALGGTDHIRDCEEVVASKVITDKTIILGNQHVKVFALSAYAAVNLLQISPTPQ